MKTYVCEYTDFADFNYAADELYDLLTDYGVGIYQANEDDNYCDWEIHCEDDGETLRECIARLKALPPDNVNEHFESDVGNKDYCTNKYVADTLERWLEYIDKKDRVIRVHWF